MTDETGCMGELRPGYSTAEGFDRYHVATVLDQPLYQQLEVYRCARQLTRSEAIRRILFSHLSKLPRKS